MSGSVIKAPGWRAVYGAEADEEAEAVPGKAKGDEEPTTVRLPLIQDKEPGRATDVRVEVAKTEPPRRITRGELPVVMGKLIDQVEEPKLKAALENPANPNEPKGLGTAATRDTVQPKLEKSRYVELLRGKDPPIQVTEIGLALVDVVRRVFPAYGDPVGRAMFEAELAEIGRAATRAEAQRRAAAYQERTRTRVAELIATISQSQAVAVDASALPVAPATSAGPPTKAMLAFATSLAARKGLKLPRGLKSNSAICRAFLDQHAPARSTGSGDQATRSGPRPPSEAMVRFAQSLAKDLGVDCPEAAMTDFAACRAFLDRHSRKAQTNSVNGRTAPPGTRRPTSEAGARTAVRKRSAKTEPAEMASGRRRNRTRPRPAAE